MDNNFSDDCKETLKLLARSRNVLISGPPAAGKSTLLAEVALAFETAFGVVTKGEPPKFGPAGGIPIPPATGSGGGIQDIPAPDKKDRKVFRTVFHQNSKYRDFVSGITPAVNKAAGEPSFTVVEGTLYRASKHAKTNSSAALLIIDEINRGPAVQVFGGTIVAIESDKRLAPDGTKKKDTQYFELLDPDSGDIIEYALPSDLYILAAMNQADTSVDALDVAFLRRWEPLRLEPDEKILRDFYGLEANDDSLLADAPADVNAALEASVRAWVSINEQISLGRGSEFQVGHGVLMSDVKPQTLPLEEALLSVCVGWAKVRSHVEEVFFGDTRGVAAVLNALDGPNYNPFKLTETTFADDLRFRLKGPANFTGENIYPAMRAFSRE